MIRRLAFVVVSAASGVVSAGSGVVSAGSGVVSAASVVVSAGFVVVSAQESRPMYDYISGRLASRRPDRAVIDAAGVGWLLLIPLSTYERLPKKEGAEARLLVVHHQREDRQALFGFATEEEREFFLVLNSVSGVGPALALSILSALPFEEFRAAVVNGDAAVLTRVKGVGKKLAARLLLELADPMKARGPVPGRPAAPTGPASDAALALVALGFDRREAEDRAAAAARELGAGAPPGEVVRRALRAARS